MSTLTQELGTEAKLGLMDFQRYYTIHTGMDRYIPQWKAINLVLEACRDEDICKRIVVYADKMQ